MKLLSITAAAAIAIAVSLGAASSSMAAMQAPGAAINVDSGLIQAQYHRHHHSGHRHHHRHVRRPVCRTETIRTRGHHGRWIVKQVRRCR